MMHGQKNIKLFLGIWKGYFDQESACQEACV